MQAIELQVRRDALAEIAPVPREIAIGDDEVLLKVDRFALTANNVTYAAHGVDMRYWDFFPAAPDHGIVPVWGFASVVDSRAAGIAPGDRFYGYWPMASHALVLPAKIGPRGFTDAAAHRLPLPPVYNGYEAASPALGPEAVQCLFRPLYTTSFVLDAMFQGRDVDTLVLTSASSKTALGLAQAAKGRQRVIGLTSAANRDFVVATGYYDEVLAYDEAAGLAGRPGRFAFVDFSGNGRVQHAVHAALGEALTESHIVGDTHHRGEAPVPLPGVAPRLFFAPTVIVERIAEWGNQGFQERLAAAWTGFIASTGWLRLEEVQGVDAVVATWAGLVAGRVDPAAGIVARL